LFGKGESADNYETGKSGSQSYVLMLIHFQGQDQQLLEEPPQLCHLRHKGRQNLHYWQHWLQHMPLQMTTVTRIIAFISFVLMQAHGQYPNSLRSEQPVSLPSRST